MLSKQIHKDVLQSYEEKIFAGLSKRKIISLAIGGAGGIGMFALLRICWEIPADIAAYAALVIAVPVFFLGFAKPKGMEAERFIPMAIDDEFLLQKIPYVATCSVAANEQIKAVMINENPSKEQSAAERRLPEWEGHPKDRRTKRIMRSAWRKWKAAQRPEAEEVPEDRAENSDCIS